MKSAIISGATGFIGSKLVNILIDSNIKVLALGRKSWSEVDPKRLQENELLTYCQVNMDEIETLPQKVEALGWSGDDCVFFNIAWGGKGKLSDLEVEYQINNIAWSANALKAAKKVGCFRFLHVGSMEEAFASKYLELDYHTNSEYNRHVVYSIAKMGSRNLLKILAKEEDIELVVATNSHVMGPNDDKDSFLQVTLQKLIDKGDEFVFSTGEQYFDVVSTYDCAYAYKLIAEKGKAYEEYWIGSGEARRLREYVEIMASLYPTEHELQFGKFAYNDISLTPEDFDIKKLTADTGYTPSMSYEQIVHQLHDWLAKGVY